MIKTRSHSEILKSVYAYWDQEAKKVLMEYLLN